MADELAAIRARIRGVRQLDTVIGTMRNIAAAHAQQSRTLLPGFRTYAEVISRAISSALRLHDGVPPGPQHGARSARVVFAAEQGFVGGFVERVLDEVTARPPAVQLLVGSRGHALAAARKIPCAWQGPMATQVDGIAGLCIRIATALYDIVSELRIASVEVVYPLWTPGEGLRVISQPLLPLDQQRFRAMPITLPPLTTLPPDLLLASLAEEYVYASLCEAAMQAFVAENEARATAMARARIKLEEMLTELHQTEHRVRQETITAELIEMVSGALAGTEPGAWSSETARQQSAPCPPCSDTTSVPSAVLSQSINPSA